MELIIVTGRSGAGKSVAVDALEDMGWYCVDNLPISMAAYAIGETLRSRRAPERMAVVTDCRSQAMGGSFDQMRRSLTELGVPFRLCYLDCDEDKLLNRYKETRRKHPLQDEHTGLSEAIAQETEILSQARAMADYYIDTTDLSRRELQDRIREIFLPGKQSSLLITCMSFGFKHGLPPEADFVLDVRCLPNPFYIEALRPLTGLDKPVYDYVFQNSQAVQLRQKLLDLLDFLIPLYIREGKAQLTIAIGCTGGHHRSVAFAQAVSEHLREKGFPNTVYHRDKER